MNSTTKTCVLIMTICCAGTARSDDFAAELQTRFQQYCVRCHGGEETNGEVDLKAIGSEKHLLAQPRLIQQLVEVLGANDMPPEGEPALPNQARQEMVARLKRSLKVAVAGQKPKPPIRRLNRYQYNNAVKDLFQLKKDVFPLPEKLMTRHGSYLLADRMPDRVEVSSRALNPSEGLQQVRAFPKDLRAAHGFDNQANQLTLSPLLLDAFLQLSVSIVESPDFTAENVGIWQEFFAPPADGGDANLIELVLRQRLEKFLRRAFRSAVDEATIQRYVTYAARKIRAGMDFSTCMKKVASAAMSSPMFLYRYRSSTEGADDLALASDLSFFLWASGPDDILLDLAERKQLRDPEVLRETIDRMMSDRKIERFLDSFPSQWMQLENVLAATPDPQRHRYFSIDKSNPAALQMLLEPLLLFDAVFVENRPVEELVSPPFAYRSDFLTTWYTGDLKPEEVDAAKIAAENHRNDEQRTMLAQQIASTRERIDELTKPIRTRIISGRKKSPATPVDLKPFAAWEFDGSLEDSIGNLHLEQHGEVKFQDGAVVLKRAYLLSKPLAMDLKAKSLEVWCRVPNLDQPGGGVMGIQGPGDFFDTIVIGERKPRHWISGSNGFSRTEDFPESTAEDKTNEMLHLVMTYTDDGTTTLYRNGRPYGKPYRKGAATFPKNRTSVIFGLRHLPPGGNRFLNVSIDKARVYDRALTAEEVTAAHSGNTLYVSNDELSQAMTDQQRKQWEQWTSDIRNYEQRLKLVPPPQDIGRLRAASQSRFDDHIRDLLRRRTFQRLPVTDPRYGGVITNAAMLSMTSGPKRTHPIARGAWIIEVIFNDPPPPPPNDVPPLNEEEDADKLTIREKFAKHRENPDCASCHSRLDPLGFAMENFGVTGRWRDKYDNGRSVDASGRLMRKYDFQDVVAFKAAIISERQRFAKAFAAHLLRFAAARELTPADYVTVEDVVTQAASDEFRLRSLIREVAMRLRD